MTKIQGVYLIQNTELPFKYKIGKSDDIHRRLKDLRMSSGCELCLIEAIKTELPTLVEKKLHLIFSDFRGIGEWFEFNPEMIGEVLTTFKSFQDDWDRFMDQDVVKSYKSIPYLREVLKDSYQENSELNNKIMKYDVITIDNLINASYIGNIWFSVFLVEEIYGIHHSKSFLKAVFKHLFTEDLYDQFKNRLIVIGEERDRIISSVKCSDIPQHLSRLSIKLPFSVKLLFNDCPYSRLIFINQQNKLSKSLEDNLESNYLEVFDKKKYQFSICKVDTKVGVSLYEVSL